VTLEEIWSWLVPLIIFAGVMIAGCIFSRLLNVYLPRATQKTKTQLDDIVLKAVKTPILLAFVLAGISIALSYVPAMPVELLQYLPTIFAILIILIVTMAVSRALRGILNYYGVTRPSLKGMMPLLSKTFNILVYFVAFILIMNALGINVTALVAGLGIAGVAVAFALQETLSQLFAGLYIMTDRPVRVGDYIELESGQKGYVVDIGWRSIKIRELPNNIIVIPNSKLAGAVVKNYYLPQPEMACLIDVGVSYDSDLEKVEKVTIEVAKNTMKRLGIDIPGFEPFIRYNKFGDFSINFTVILRVKEFVDKYLLVHEFVKDLHRRYQEEGIVIPFPIRTVYMKGGPDSTS